MDLSSLLSLLENIEWETSLYQYQLVKRHLASHDLWTNKLDFLIQ